MITIATLIREQVTHVSYVRQYVALPAGIIKGALHRLGFQATVSPEITTLPQCMQIPCYQGLRSLTALSGTFQIKLPKGS